ncbi:hypothetical protein K1T73_00370 [Roseovarius sp. SCSIO 43702]|uniref:hypothetical protein n=1 Tax=Roseovarius sp. SCSIO 43702 TaxID=2823043 RepID=UPI001C72C22B|nr:hypothetical protein [Roseovarius sp. SCSIO 43702]QYX56910.1 hypothetical protein K1T73_00370 [Roseovarius sp. SCSIO 43702]
MKHMTFLLALVSVLIGAPAHAGCRVEYKAKRDNPLELYYDVAQIDGPCTVAAATEALQARLAAAGLTLLKVLSVSET